MRRLKITLEYDGTNYHGWQSQKGGGTIQDTVSTAIAVIGGSPVTLTGASRTDAGVHALGQVAAFSTGSVLPPEVWQRALNAKLPADIRVTDAAEAADDFHPRHALTKSYFYLIALTKTRSAFLSRYCWDIPYALDCDRMRAAAELLVGEHDFSAFMASGCSSRHQVRSVYSLDVERLDGMSFMSATLPGTFLKIHVEANAFLRHMVRNMVGTLVEVGGDSIPAEEVSAILRSRNRKNAGATAPAQGLFLERIVY